MAVCIGIAGGAGAGKSTLAQLLAARLPASAAIIEHDWYYHDQAHLPFERRFETNYDHPNALDTGLLIAQLSMLREGRAVDAPRYDYTRHIRASATHPIEPHAVYIVEGIHVLHEKNLRRLFDLKIYLDLPADLRFIRRLERDIAQRGRTMQSVVAQYLRTVRPMHARYVEPARHHADIVVDEEDDLPGVAERLCARLAERTAP